MALTFFIGRYCLVPHIKNVRFLDLKLGCSAGVAHADDKDDVNINCTDIFLYMFYRKMELKRRKVVFYMDIFYLLVV